MLRGLAFASFILLAPSLVSAETAKFRVEEATIEDIQGAILRGEVTSTQVVQLYLARIKAYNGTCVEQPDGVLGAGPIKPIKNAHQLNALMTLNLRPSTREKLGFDGRCTGGPNFNGIALALSANTEADAELMFNALADGGKVNMPLGKTFFSPKFGMVADKFGVGWMVLHPKEH